MRERKELLVWEKEKKKKNYLLNLFSLPYLSPFFLRWLDPAREVLGQRWWTETKLSYERRCSH